MSALEAAKEIDWLSTGVLRDSDRANRMAEIIDRLAVQPAVAAERKRAEGLVAVIRAGIPKVQFSFDVSQSSTVCYELRHLKLTLERALADYESNAPVPMVTSFLSSQTSNVATNAINAKVTAPVPKCNCRESCNGDRCGCSCHLAPVPTEETGVKPLDVLWFGAALEDIVIQFQKDMSALLSKYKGVE